MCSRIGGFILMSNLSILETCKGPSKDQGSYGALWFRSFVTLGKSLGFSFTLPLCRSLHSLSDDQMSYNRRSDASAEARPPFSKMAAQATPPHPVLVTVIRETRPFLARMKTQEVLGVSVTS